MTTLTFANYVESGGAANTFGVCLGNDGNVWAVSSGGGIWKTTPSGTITSISLPSPQSATWICQGSDGYMYATGAEGGGLGVGAVWKIDPTTMAFTRYGGGPYYLGTCCTGPDGNVWMTTQGNTVYKFDITTTTVTGYTLGGSAFFMIISHGGYLWLSDTTGALVRLDTSGTFTRYAIAATTLRSLCVDTSGDFWLGGTDIYRVTPTGTVLTHISGFGATEIIGCIQASDGNIYFGDASNPNIYQVVPGSSSVSVVMSTGEIANPWGVCIGADGNMWWAESGGDSSTWKVGFATMQIVMMPQP